MRVLVTGYYGAGNFGDDIMLEVICNELKANNKNVEIDILKLFNKELKINVDHGVKIVTLDAKNRYIKKLIFMNVIRKYDLFIWGGGTCFTDTDGDGLYDYMKIARRLGVKIGYIGVGVGKLTVEERINRADYLLKNASIITVRDKYSYEYCLEKIHNIKPKLSRAEDIAYLYIDNIRNRLLKEKKEHILVSWRNLIGYKGEETEKKYINKLVSFIEKINKKNQDKIVILPLDDRKDIEINRYIYDKLVQRGMRNITILENLSPLEKIKVIAKSKLNISGRLHGIFISEILNIDTIGLSYSIKINEFLASINKENDFIDVDEISTERLYDIYKAEKKNISEELYKNCVKLSKLNISKLVEVVE